MVCHGIPSDDKKLKRGDIVNIDVTVIKDGYFGDNSKMYVVGETNIRSQNWLKRHKKHFMLDCVRLSSGIRLNEIGKAVQNIPKAKVLA